MRHFSISQIFFLLCFAFLFLIDFSIANDRNTLLFSERKRLLSSLEKEIRRTQHALGLTSLNTPRDLRAHLACLKFGRGCTELYVVWLTDLADIRMVSHNISNIRDAFSSKEAGKQSASVAPIFPTELITAKPNIEGALEETSNPDVDLVEAEQLLRLYQVLKRRLASFQERDRKGVNLFLPCCSKKIERVFWWFIYHVCDNLVFWFPPSYFPILFSSFLVLLFTRISVFIFFTDYGLIFKLLHSFNWRENILETHLILELHQEAYKRNFIRRLRALLCALTCFLVAYTCWGMITSVESSDTYLNVLSNFVSQGTVRSVLFYLSWSFTGGTFFFALHEFYIALIDYEGHRIKLIQKTHSIILDSSR